MLFSPDRRIRLAAAPSPAATPALEAVFVGLAAAVVAPGAAVAAMQAARELGFAPDETLTGVPLAFDDATAFGAAFPGDTSWLAAAVRDYFAAGGLRAWVVRADPATGADPLAAGIAVAVQVPSAGLLVLPELEATYLAAAIPPPALPAAPAAPPEFTPLTDRLPPPPGPAPDLAPPSLRLPPLSDVLHAVGATLVRLRPDTLCLFALPVGADEAALPTLIRRARSYLFGPAESAPDLPSIQAFAPLLRNAVGAIASPSGLIAGALAANAQAQGVWRSLAGRALPTSATPLRRIESNALDALRRAGIVAIRAAPPGGIMLDDDILAYRDRPAAALARAAPARRLTGALMRRLHAAGEQLVFENILDDGRVELVLHDVFAALLAQGALTGRTLDEAVAIARSSHGDGALQFDIAFAASVPLETIRLRFLDGALTTSLEQAA